MEVKRLIVHVLRFLLGGIFIYSAFAKLYPIEGFELFILEHSFFSWNVCTLLARLLIAVELGLGVFLCLNIYSKRVQQLSIALLVVFSIYLLYLHFSSKNVENCNCFGSHLMMTPLQSFLKNIILLSIAFVVYRFRTAFTFKYKPWIALALSITALSLPSILSPPDFLIKNRYDNNIAGNLQLELLEEVDFIYNEKNYNLSEGKWIVCFYSTGCQFCKMANTKLSLFSERHNLPDNVFVFFFGQEESIQEFWEETNSKGFPYKILPPAEFFTLGGNRLPSIFFINNQKIEHHCLYRDLFEEDVTDFLAD